MPATVNSNLERPAAWPVLPACMLLGGLAGIVYQISWARQLEFGATDRRARLTEDIRELFQTSITQ